MAVDVVEAVVIDVCCEWFDVSMLLMFVVNVFRVFVLLYCLLLNSVTTH